MRIAVIADDLTGANATGVRLSKQGFSTATIVRGSPLPEEYYDAVCLDTDSRYQTPGEAKNRVEEALGMTKNEGAQIFCKRVDSTLRGNIGTEIDVFLNGLGPETTALIVPAFPDSGRCTVGGFLLVEGKPLQETDAAKDPLIPVESSRVSEIIRRQSNHRISEINIDTVYAGKSAVAAQIQKEIDRGNRILVIDAVSEKQIEVIADAAASLKRQFVPVDPGPFTAAYAKKMNRNTMMKGKILVAVGSATSLTQIQLNEMIQLLGINPVFVNPENLATFTDRRKEEMRSAVNQAMSRMETEDIILVTTCHPDFKRLNFKEIAKEEFVSQESLSRQLTDGLATISHDIIKQSNSAISACFLSGGDVTASFCRVSSAKRIELKNEVLPLTAYGRLIGGAFHHLPVITKGGMVGHSEAIYDCVEFLIRKSSETTGERNDGNGNRS